MVNLVHLRCGDEIRRDKYYSITGRVREEPYTGRNEFNLINLRLQKNRRLKISRQKGVTNWTSFLFGKQIKS